MAISVGTLEALITLHDELSPTIENVAAAVGMGEDALNAWTEAEQRASMAMSGTHDAALELNQAFDAAVASVGKWTEENQRGAMAMSALHDQALAADKAMGAWTKENQDAAMAMARTHAEALKMNAEFDKSNATITKVSKALESAGKSMTAAGQAVLPLSVALTAAGVAGIKFSGDFDASMRKLVSLAGVSSTEIQGVRDHILELAPAAGIGPQELADAMTVVSSTISNTSVAMGILDTAAQGTKAGLGETKDVARALTAVINAYGAENITAAQAGDILTKTVQDGGAEAKELAPALGAVIPLAAQLGISFAEVGANVATFTKLGVPAAEAVTSLRSVMTALLNPTKEQTEALKSVNLTLGELRAQIKEKGLAAAMIDLSKRFGENKEGLAQVFGRVEALVNVMGTAGQQASTYAEEIDRITNSMGTLAKASAAIDGNSIQTWNQLLAMVQVIAIKFGNELAPTFGKVVDEIKPMLEVVADLIKWFGQLPEPVRESVIAMGAVIAVAGPLLIALGSMASALGALGVSAGAATASLGPLGAAIATFVVTYTLTTWVMEQTGAMDILKEHVVEAMQVYEMFRGAEKGTGPKGYSVDDLGSIDAWQKKMAEAKAAVDANVAAQDALAHSTADTVDAFEQAAQAAIKAGEERKKAALTAEEIEAQKAFEKAVQGAAAQMNDGIKGNAVMAAALERVGGVATLSAAQIQKYGADVEKAAQAGATLTNAQLALLATYKEGQWIQQWNQHLAEQRSLQEGLASALGQSVENISVDANRMADAVERNGGVMQLSDEQLKKFIEDLEKAAPAMREAAEGGMDTTLAQEAYARALKEAADRGVLAGKALKEYEANLKANVSATSIAEEKARRFAEAIAAIQSVLGKVGGILSGAGQLLEAFGVSAESGLGRALSAMQDFQGAAQAGVKAFAQFSSGDILGGIGSSLSAISGLVKGFKGLFGGGDEEAKKMAEELKKVKAATIEAFGSMDQFRKTAAAMGVDVERAFSTKNPKEFQKAVDAVNKAMEAHEKRLQAAHDAVGFLEQRMKGFAETIDRGGLSLGEQAQRLEHYKEKLKEAGLSEEEMKRLIKERAAALDHAGVATQSAQDGFDRMGRFAIATFAALVAETGNVIGALREMGPSLDQLIELQAQFGFTSSDALTRLMGMRAVIAENEDLAASIEGLNGLMKSLGETGGMNAALFQDFASDAGALYNELIGRGVDADMAMAMMQPTLQQLWEQQQRFGTVTDETTLALIRQAEEQGLVGESMMSVNNQILEVLKILVETVGGTLPDAFRRMGQAARDGFDSVENGANNAANAVNNIPGGGNGGGGHNAPAHGEGYDVGGYATGPTSGYGATLHGNEFIVPDKPQWIDALAARIGSAMPRSSGGGAPTHITIEVVSKMNEAEMGRGVAHLISTGQVSVLPLT